MRLARVRAQERCRAPTQPDYVFSLPLRVGRASCCLCLRSFFLPACWLLLCGLLPVAVALISWAREIQFHTAEGGGGGSSGIFVLALSLWHVALSCTLQPTQHNTAAKPSKRANKRTWRSRSGTLYSPFLSYAHAQVQVYTRASPPRPFYIRERCLAPALLLLLLAARRR